VRPLLLATLALLLAMWQPGAAHADERIARRHFDAGQRLSASGDYAGAYDEFAAGYAMSQRPAFLFNMGECARALGDPSRARASYERYLELDPDGPLVARARARLATLPAPEAAPGPPPAPRAHSSPLVSTAARAAVARDAALELGPVSVPPRRESHSVWRSPWLWAGVGALAAGSLAIYVFRHDDGACTASCLDFR
jgi:tetratricopeptide (TPR) repeat protein